MKQCIYNPKEIENKYKNLWELDSYINGKKSNKGKYYCLDMFPYPSANGVHVGHWRGYVLSDIYARKKWLEGYEILHPMGWDAFGLPAENYAIKNKIHPKVIVKESISNFKEQIKKIGALYNWDKEINTTDPEYYKWTQWIFLKMYQAGLAYQSFTDMNWCPQCKTGLANEEIVKGKCERCGAIVENKKIRQWMLRITKYAEQLLEGLDNLNWPEKVKTMQKNWIGKSIGLEITFKYERCSHELLQIYTTRPETIYGVCFIAISHNHPFVEEIIKHDQKKHIIKLIEEFQKKQTAKDNEIDLFDGIFLEEYAIHPITNKLIPIYIARYVLSDYGTGSIMGVPAHDNRDYEFALRHKIYQNPVVMNPDGDNNTFYEGIGILFNSNQFNGMNSNSEGRKSITDFLIQQKIGIKKINYKMRDWIFSRQRYWGEPIPLIHCEKCGIVEVPESELPVLLPYVEKYEPSGNGESPLQKIDDWINIKCYKCNGNAKRETNTMPQWAGSCWYFLRYPDPHNKKNFCSQELLSKWLPVDLYVGGVEHAILHLLYARFYIKFLFEQKLVPFNEPFLELFNQGMINYKSEKTGYIEKMSKSKGNIVNPDDIIEKYGIDALRLYIIFIAPPELDCIWQNEGVLGCYRFLKKFWAVMTKKQYEDDITHSDSLKATNIFLKQFSERIETMHTNTAVAAMMEFINKIIANELKLTKEMKIKILSNCSIMIPYICSELLSFYDLTLQECHWNNYNEKEIIEDTSTIIIQVNGKMRDTITVSKEYSRNEIEKLAHNKVQKWLIPDSEKIKIIYVQEKLVNFVFK